MRNTVYQLNAQYITTSGTTSQEAVRPVNLKFCDNPNHLESTIALDFIEFHDYDALTSSVLRTHVDQKAKKSQETFNLEPLEDIVE